MQPEKLFDFYKKFQKDKLAIIYKGDFTNYVLGMVTILVKDFLLENENLVKLRNKLSFLIIEAFQNTMRYGDHQYKDQADLAHELFILRNIEQVFYIITANLIENSRINYVYDKLEQVNKLTEEELKDLYVQILTNKQLTDRGGAGLGFIEMVRKTKEKLDFDFVPVSQLASFFYFQLKMRPKNTNAPQKYLPISDAKDLHKIVSKENILIIHKGDYDEKSVIPLLKMAEKNFRSEEFSYQKKTFIMLVETLQNISKHALAVNGIKDGISMISLKKGNYFITSGNFVENSKVPALQEKLNYLKRKTKAELDKYYINLLRSDNIKQGGLGLIDIARETKNFDFNFKKIDDKKTFFALTIEV